MEKCLLTTSSFSATHNFEKKKEFSFLFTASFSLYMYVSLFKRIFYAFAVFILKLINRHSMRDNMMLKHIIYVSIFYIYIFFPSSMLMLAAVHSYPYIKSLHGCLLGCMRLLNNVWINVASVTLYRRDRVH